MNLYVNTIKFDNPNRYWNQKIQNIDEQQIDRFAYNQLIIGVFDHIIR